MPSNIPAAPKSQYEIERDERIKRNEAFMLSIGIDPHGGGYIDATILHTGLISARSSRTRATSRTSTAATTATAGS